MISALLLLFVVTIGTIDGMPYSLDQEVTKILERRGKPIVCDALKPGSVVFAFDTSDDTTDFPEQKDYAEKVVKFLPENDAVTVAGIVYGGSTATPVPPEGRTYDELVAELDGITDEEHGPRDEVAALETAAGLLNTATGVKVIVLFVDGAAKDAPATKAKVDELDKQGITVFFVFAKEKYASLQSELKEMAEEPHSQTLNAMNNLGLAESIGIAFDVQYSC